MWTSLGLNQGPPDYESVALTNWATSPACQQGCDKFCGAKVRIMSEMCKFFSLNLKKWILVVLSNVLFHSTFSRHGKAQASLALLIWLNENVLLVLLLFVINALLFPSFLFAPYASKLFVMCFLLFCNTYYLHIFSSNRTFAPYCQVWVLIKASFRLASNRDCLPIKINNRWSSGSRRHNKGKANEANR